MPTLPADDAGPAELWDVIGQLLGWGQQKDEARDVTADCLDDLREM